MPTGKELLETTNVPYWDRTPYSFSPSIIAYAKWVPKDNHPKRGEGRGGYWYATLRTKKRDIGMPDFLSYGSTKEEAEQNVVNKVINVWGTDAYGRAFKPKYHTWGFVLCAYWWEIEQEQVRQALLSSDWI